MGVVEIVSQSGVYDYKAKYTPGSTEYLFPAELEPAVEAKIKDHAEQLFDACGLPRLRTNRLFAGWASGPIFWKSIRSPGLPRPVCSRKVLPV